MADELWRRPARYGSGRDYEIGVLDVFGQNGCNLGLLRGRQFTGVTADARCIDTCIDERGTQRFDLPLGVRSHVVAFDHRAEPVCRRRRLQTGDAKSDDQHFGGADRAGGAGKLGQDTGKMGGTQLHGVIAGQRGLAGQRVHCLGAGNPWHPLHGKAGDLSVQQPLHQSRFIVFVDEGDKDRPLLHRVNNFQRGRLHGKNDIGIAHQRLDVGNDSHVLVDGIGKLHCISGTGLHAQPGAKLRQSDSDRGHERHAPLMRLCLLQNGDVDVHGVLRSGQPSWNVEGTRSARPPGSSRCFRPALRRPRNEPASCSRTPGCPCRRVHGHSQCP